MMDAYSFDKTEEDMLNTYNELKDAYFRIFRRLDIVPTISDNETIGAKVSHEWQAKLELGEDIIVYDAKNNIGLNAEVLDFDNRDEYLAQFGINDINSLVKYNTVELGHTFQLGIKYSESMKLYYKDENGEDKHIIWGVMALDLEELLVVF